MVVGITILGLVYFKDQTAAMGGNFDAEKILPNVIRDCLRPGIIGFVLAGLLAAFMSTFTSTINAGASYIVNDLYKKHINPNASDKRYVHASYICSILIVIVGIIFGYMTESVNKITQWIVAGLWGGYTAPNVLKWYWWRFNGKGYFGGMMSGIVAAMVLPKIFHSDTLWNIQRDMAIFPMILGISAIASVVISLATSPDDEGVLKKFYKQVRPWGFWGPIRDKVMKEDPAFRPNKNFGRDMINVAVGIVWQLMLVLIPTYLLIRSYRNMWISIAVLIATSVFLKKKWYDKLESQ
jgi:Na+/proline symporter